MDTPYTQGFKAGLVWENERISELLHSDKWHDMYLEYSSDGKGVTRKHFKECIGCKLIALIKGEASE